MLFKKFKKSQIEYVAIFIIAAIFIGIMIVFAVKIGKTSEYNAWKTECKTSAETSARFGMISSVFAEDIKCPTLDITVDENSARSEIKKLVVDCWDIYGQGKLDLFSDENTYCAVCAIFDFKEKNKEIRLIGKEFDYAGTINTNNLYSVIFIYAKGREEIEAFKEMLIREKNGGKISAYIGPHFEIDWAAASVLGEYTAEGLSAIGCKAIPIKQ